MDSQEEVMTMLYTGLFIVIVILIIWALFYVSGWLADIFESWFKKKKNKNHHE